MFTKNFKGVYRSLKGDSRKFQECFKEVSMVLQGVSKQFQGSFEIVLRVFQGRLMGIKRKISVGFKGI